MNINIAICDDDIMTLETIPGAVIGNFRFYGYNATVDKFKSPVKLLESLEANYSLFFLDIDMPELDGIKTAETILKKNPKATIIFVSGREERVFDAFSVHPFGFVRKSNFIGDLSKIIKQYAETMSKVEESENYINVEVKNTIQRIAVAEIIYIESYRDIKSIHVTSSKDPIEVRLTMECFEEKLVPLGFCRIHKGYIINYQHVTRIDNNDVTMDDKSVLPISRRKLQEIRQGYLKFERK